MSRWKLLASWDRDLPVLTVAELRERLRIATEYETRSDQAGMGHNPKARRDLRKRREAVQAEMASRGLI